MFFTHIHFLARRMKVTKKNGLIFSIFEKVHDVKEEVFEKIRNERSWDKRFIPCFLHPLFPLEDIVSLMIIGIWHFSMLSQNPAMTRVNLALKLFEYGLSVIVIPIFIHTYKVLSTQEIVLMIKCRRILQSYGFDPSGHAVMQLASGIYKSHVFIVSKLIQIFTKV